MTSATAPRRQPRGTTDLDQARNDLDEFGYCIVEDAISTAHANELRLQVLDLGARQVGSGLAVATGGTGARNVMQLLHYGQDFVDLAFHPISLELVDHVLGPTTPTPMRGSGPADFLLSSISALVLVPGDRRGFAHNDQIYVPGPTPIPFVANVMWMLSDFVPENGATLFVPGSHRSPAPPSAEAIEAAVPAVGRAGSAVCFEGRTWHRSGSNISDSDVRVGVSAYYCASWFRQKENHVAALGLEACASQPPRVRRMLGFDPIHTLGTVTPKGSSRAINEPQGR